MTAPRHPTCLDRPGRWIAAATLLALAGCGVEGPPQAPSPAPSPGVSVTGEARIGVTGRL